VILFLPTTDIDPLSARAARKVVPYCNTSPTRPLDDLSALVEGADLAVLRLLGGFRASNGSPDAPSVAACSGFGEIAASTCTANARERGVV
jgi:cobaltochelatase CobN